MASAISLTGRTMAFMGTRVSRGRARGIVANTGIYTELGAIAGMLARVEPEDTPLEQDLERFGQRVVLGCIAVSALVFAAGPPELNAHVVADARARGVWVNSANVPAASDFLMPSTVRRAGFVVAVGTGGAAPALARHVRRQLEGQFDEAFGKYVELLGEMRLWIKATFFDPLLRQRMYNALTGPEWPELMRAAGADAVRVAMIDHLRTLLDASAEQV